MDADVLKSHVCSRRWVEMKGLNYYTQTPFFVLSQYCNMNNNKYNYSKMK